MPFLKLPVIYTDTSSARTTLIERSSIIAAGPSTLNSVHSYILLQGNFQFQLELTFPQLEKLLTPSSVKRNRK